MRVALVAPPFIPVPPRVYGGTELFIAQLAIGLKKLGIEVVVYANGESTVNVEKRWLYPESQWPISGEVYDNLKDINHTAWAVRDACETCDIIHLNNLPGLVHSRFVNTAFVYTVHHPHEPRLSEFYRHYPDVHYVTISDFQRRRETMPHIRTIHHGIDVSLYQLVTEKKGYFSFLGRIAPIKGTHIAIQVAKKTGIPLKIAGEVQPMFRDYFDAEIKPHLDGKFIEYIGQANLETKKELLGGSIALLFPIQWNEPFGLVMIEAMACGTPVLALHGGSVEEVVADGVSGWVARCVEELVARARTVAGDFKPAAVRAYVERGFSLDRMVLEYANHYRAILNQGQAAQAAAADGEQRAIA
ncbi:MAG: glycosyltransferase family 4 protein [Terriglobales bacterium]